MCHKNHLKTQTKLYILPFGFIIDAYGLTGIKSIQCAMCFIQFTAIMIFTITYRNDNYHGQWDNEMVSRWKFLISDREDVSIKSTALELFGGMKKIWLTKDPTIFVTPLTVGFLFYFMNYIGVVSILFNYTQGPPFSMNSAAYSILLGVRGVMSIIVSIVLIFVQGWFLNFPYFCEFHDLGISRIISEIMKETIRIKRLGLCIIWYCCFSLSESYLWFDKLWFFILHWWSNQ